MYSVLVLGKGMHDAAGNIQPGATTRLDAAIAWAQTHPGAVIYTAAYIPPDWPVETEPHAVVMERYVQAAGVVHTHALIEPCHFNTRGELQNFSQLHQTGWSS